jgi:hypothetical protein
MLMIWSHGQQELKNFLNHLNNIHFNIQFAMEIESDGYLPFLYIDIHGRTDGSLGHSVYPTHTYLFLNAEPYHHPANKHSVLTILLKQATAICDKGSLPGELEFLHSTFKQNSYNDTQTHHALNLPHKKDTPTEEPTWWPSYSLLDKSSTASAEC